MIRSLSATVKAILLVAVIGAGGLGLWPASVEAHGVVDQAWDNVISAGGYQILSNSPLGQEFTPSADTVAAADVLLGALNQAGDATITLRIREATIAGTILGSTSQTVSESFSDDAGCGVAVPCKFFHFDLASPIAVVPGQTYVIELVSSNASHSWEYDPLVGGYLGGQQIISGSVNTDIGDFFFRTYSDVPAPVGGIGVFPDSGDSSGGSVAALAGFAAIATAIALAGAAWYARRSWAR